MRNFLTDINIVGVTLVARCGSILYYTVPNLLKWCNWVLLMVDNENDETMKVVRNLMEKYPDRIKIAYTGFPRATPEQEKEPRGLFHRFKPLQGPIRETVFKYFRDLENGVLGAPEKVDILIWPDSDEIFSDSLPELLEKFWAMPDKKAITMKPVDVFGDLMTVHSKSMTGHTRIFKFFHELTAIPYRTACNYRPLTKADRIGCNRILIHLASLTPDKRSWRNVHWKPNTGDYEALWKLPREITQMTPEELSAIFKKEPDLTVEEYLRGGDKRMPTGVENAFQAMAEAHTLLGKMGIKLYLAFGTCLGLVRDGGLIKWDWDVDFIMLGEDINKLDIEEIQRAGFTDIKIKKDLPRTKDEKGNISEDLMIRTISFKKFGVRVDIDPAYMSEDETSRIILKGRKRQKFCAKHPREWFDTPEVIKYRDMEFIAPSPVTEYLESNYGSEWKIPAYGPTAWSTRSCMSQTYACKKI